MAPNRPKYASVVSNECGERFIREPLLKSNLTARFLAAPAAYPSYCLATAWRATAHSFCVNLMSEPSVHPWGRFFGRASEALNLSPGSAEVIFSGNCGGAWERSQTANQRTPISRRAPRVPLHGRPWRKRSSKGQVSMFCQLNLKTLIVCTFVDAPGGAAGKPGVLPGLSDDRPIPAVSFIRSA